MEVISTKAFLKGISKLQVTADELQALEAEIIANPQAGDVIKGLKGIRKIRFSYGGKGKRGGGRCIYLVLTVADQVYLLLAYGKSQQTDLSAKQRKNLLAFIEDLQ
jgi:hypothetical protein